MRSHKKRIIKFMQIINFSKRKNKDLIYFLESFTPVGLDSTITFLKRSFIFKVLKKSFSKKQNIAGSGSIRRLSFTSTKEESFFPLFNFIKDTPCVVCIGAYFSGEKVLDLSLITGFSILFRVSILRFSYTPVGKNFPLVDKILLSVH
jgi:hypothetical protein